MLAGIFYINLDKRADRKNKIEKGIAASDLDGTPVHRISAYNSIENDYTHLLASEAITELEDLKTTGVRTHHAQLSMGAIGCYLSHFETWKVISELPGADDALYLILEDDALVPRKAKHKMQKGIDALAESGVDLACKDGMPFILLWELICLQGCPSSSSNYKKIALFEPELFWSMQTYTISGGGARSLVHLPLFPILNQIDTEITFCRNSGKMKIFAFPFFTNGSFDTDIQVAIRKDASYHRGARKPAGSSLARIQTAKTETPPPAAASYACGIIIQEVDVTEEDDSDSDSDGGGGGGSDYRGKGRREVPGSLQALNITLAAFTSVTFLIMFILVIFIALRT